MVERRWPPKLIAGRYELDERLGSGGMGDVWGGVDLQSGTPVAVKLIKEDLQEEPQIRDRFHREAKIAASLEHPNIVTILDVGEDDGVLYLVMERLSGPDLHTLVRTAGPLPIETAVDYIGQTAAGLAAAHAASIVHKDIKPENLMLDGQGTLKILDFGIARVSDATEHTASRTIGSFKYWAPERLDGRPATALSDLYSLGCVAMTLLTKSPPFSGEPARVMSGHLNETPERASARRADVPPALDDLTAYLMAKDPQARWPRTAQDVMVWARTHPQGRALEGEGTIQRTWVPTPETLGPERTAPPQSSSSQADTMLRPPASAAAPPTSAPTPAPRKQRVRPSALIAMGVAAVLMTGGVATAGVLAGPRVVQAIRASASQPSASPTPGAAAEAAANPSPSLAAEAAITPSPSPLVQEQLAAAPIPDPVIPAPITTTRGSTGSGNAAVPAGATGQGQAPTGVTNPPPVAAPKPVTTQKPVTQKPVTTQKPVVTTKAAQPSTSAPRGQATLALSKGSRGNNVWCISSQCRAVVVSGQNFAPNATYLVSYHASGGTCPAHGTSASNPKATTDSAGKLRVSNYYYDCAGASVWVTVNLSGQTISSNTVAW